MLPHSRSPIPALIGLAAGGCTDTQVVFISSVGGVYIHLNFSIRGGASAAPVSPYWRW